MIPTIFSRYHDGIDVFYFRFAKTIWLVARPINANESIRTGNEQDIPVDGLTEHLYCGAKELHQVWGDSSLQLMGGGATSAAKTLALIRATQPEELLRFS